MTLPVERLLPRRTIASYAIGSIGTGGFGTLPGLVLLFFLTDTLGVPAIWAGALVGVAKIWDVIIDPVIGSRSDRSLAATGSRRRLMLLGSILLPVLFLLTFAVPAGLPPFVSGLWVLLAFMATATAFSLFQVPYIALPAELASGYDQRTRLLSARVVVLTFAILLFGAGGPLLRRLGGDDEHLGYLIMALVAGLVIGGGMFISSFTAKRGTAVDAPSASIAASYRAGVAVVRRSQPFRALLATFGLQALATGLMLAGAQYVANSVMGDRDAVDILFAALIAPALLFAPVWQAVARRIGKERAYVVASLFYGVGAVSLIGMLAAPGWWIYVPVGLAGAGYAGMQSLPMAMLPDVISHDAATSGEGHAGTFGGVWTATETTGFALGSTALTIVLALTGYVETVGAQFVWQSDLAIAGIIIAFSIVPAAFIAVSLVTFRRYRLRKVDIDV
jgi:glycoside/pentoside/hexuronide:cation symporter, GPH family